MLVLVFTNEYACLGEIKRYAKSGNNAAAKLIAKEVVSARRAVNRLYAAKAQMNSVMMEMDHQAAAVRMAGALQSSTQVMQSMSRLVKVPEIQATMMEMSKEMTKMGIMEEMMEDSMEGVLDGDDMEEEIEQAVEKVLAELTGEKLDAAPDVGGLSVPGGAVGGQVELPDEEPEDMMDMQRRLEQLRS